jgi:hypothetical protein
MQLIEYPMAETGPNGTQVHVFGPRDLRRDTKSLANVVTPDGPRIA